MLVLLLLIEFVIVKVEFSSDLLYVGDFIFELYDIIKAKGIVFFFLL